MSELVTLGGAALTVTLSTLGAELRSVVDAEGRDWLWDGDPRWWTGRAPIIFPTVGVTAGNVARFDGQAYPLGKHGFARGAMFTVVETGSHQAIFRLEDDAETRAVYPFAFRLDLRYAVEGASLAVSATVTNRGDRKMPVGFGFHPAFRWPLPGTGEDARARHIVRFDEPEPEPLRELSSAGLLLAAPRPTPVQGQELHLRDDLFEHDALIWDRPHSRGVKFGVADGPGLRVEFPSMPMLGIWTKPGAGFLCIEPWHSRADDEGFEGEFSAKPGIVSLEPGSQQVYAMTIHIGRTLSA